jgi:hypothetical protein
MRPHLLLGPASAPLLGCGLALGGLESPDASLWGSGDASSESDDDGGASPESGTDVIEGATPCDPLACSGACCGDACVTPDCAGCAAGGIYCASTAGGSGTCVASCSSCPVSDGPTVTCYSCGDAGLAARCAGSSSECPSDLASGACPCPSGTPEDCPGAQQVCAQVAGTFVCLTN